MIIFIVFIITSTVLASNCWIEYTALLVATGKTIPAVTIDTNYSQVFNACDVATGGIYEIRYEINNTDTVDVRMYYELSQVISDSYIRKNEVCNGSCVSGNIYICCGDFGHKFIRIIVENLKKNSSVVLQSLSIRYAQEWVVIASVVGFILICTSIIILLLLCLGCLCIYAFCAVEFRFKIS